MKFTPDHSRKNGYEQSRSARALEEALFAAEQHSTLLLWIFLVTLLLGALVVFFGFSIARSFVANSAGAAALAFVGYALRFICRQYDKSRERVEYYRRRLLNDSE